MQVGMLMDATLQALLRGTRDEWASVGTVAGWSAVIPQTKQTGLSKDDYRRMFPGVNLVDDVVLMPPKPLKGRLKELDAIVVRRLEAGETEMTNASLREELGMSERNYRALVQKQEWQARRAQLGLNPQKLNGRLMGLRRVA